MSKKMPVRPRGIQAQLKDEHKGLNVSASPLHFGFVEARSGPVTASYRIDDTNVIVRTYQHGNRE
jgi:hypothetical protein